MLGVFAVKKTGMFTRGILVLVTKSILVTEH